MSAITPDPQWLKRFARGDTDVMAQIYRDNLVAVRRSAGRILSWHEDRDAVAQDVFTKIIGSRRVREGFRGGDLSSWLVTIARNRALNVVRHERRRAHLSEGRIAGAVTGGLRTDPPADVLPDVERFALRLDEKRRALLRMRFIEGMTQAETAAKLGMPRSTAEGWEHHIKTRLQAIALGAPSTQSERKRS